MEQKSVSIYHTCTVQHVRELIPLLKMMIGNNLPQTELNVTAEGSIYFKNRVAWELPLNQQSPRNEGEAKEAAEYWLKEVRKREANAKTLYQNTQNKAESYLPLFFHTNWTFLKALPEYSDKNLLRYWKVIYSPRLQRLLALCVGTVGSLCKPNSKKYFCKHILLFWFAKIAQKHCFLQSIDAFYWVGGNYAQSLHTSQEVATNEGL